MDRQRLIGRLTGGLASCVLLALVARGEDAPPAPWATSSSSADASVAAWANSSLAPAAKPSDAPPSATTPSEAPPLFGAASPNPASNDRYGASNRYADAPRAATMPANTTPANPIRSGSPSTAPLRLDPSTLGGNPLRGSSEPTLRVGASKGSPAAREAFANPSTTPAPFAGAESMSPPAPTPVPSQSAPQRPAPQRFVVGATPVPVAPPATDPTSGSEAVTYDNEPIAAETPAPLAPVERAQVEPSPASATPPAVWQDETPEPVRVAAASAYDEPAQFEASFSDTTPASPLREGVGQPGPESLEGPQEAALVVEKRGPREARIGQSCRFAVRVRNTGSAAAENVVLTDQAPAGARLLRTSPTADQQQGRLVWRLGTLAAGEERTVEIELEPLREGPLGSVATVTMDASASASTTCTRPQLSMRMVTPGDVLLGDEQTIAIELHNPGTGSATNVMLVEDVPPQLRHAAGPALEFEVGTLQPGETRRVDLRMTGAMAGHVVNTVAAIADGDLRAERSVEFDVVAPSLAVSIDGPKRRYLERPASYKIGVDNPGTAPAKDVRLVTHLPRGMEFVSANNLGEYDATTHSVYWSLAELPEGERGEVEVVAMPIAAGEHTLRAQSEARDGLEAEHTHNVRVEGVASLAFEVRDLQDPIELGDETVYEIRVLNEGTKAATGVRVRVEAPTGLKVVAGQGQTAGRVQAGRAEFAPLARLEPGQKVAYRVRVTGAEPGDQRVTVLVESDEMTRPIRREESTRVFGDE